MTSEYPDPIKAQIKLLEEMREQLTKPAASLQNLAPPSLDTASVLATARMNATASADLAHVMAGLDEMTASLVAIAEEADQNTPE